MTRIIAALAALAAWPAMAQDLDSMAKAGQLSGLLASESICGLSYDQAAIQAWVVANVPGDDMTFASNLNLQTKGNAMMFERQSKSERTAHCAATTQSAKHFGFIK